MKMTDVGKFRRLLAAFEYDAEDLSAFFDLWLDNHAGQYDLNWFISQPHPLSKEQREEILCNQLSYLNALYAGQAPSGFKCCPAIPVFNSHLCGGTIEKSIFGIGGSEQ